MHKEYYVRVAIVSVWALAIAVVAGAGALFPADIRARAADRAALDAVSVAKNSNKNSADLDAAEKQLADAAALVKALGSGSTAPFSNAIRSIVSAHSPVLISTLAIDRQGTSTVSVSIQGVAPTRNDLLAFKSRLEALAPGATVDLPISVLAKNADISFTLKFVADLP